jgi:hypothetical protein
MATTPGARTRFRDGQLLSAADLNDEQADQIARHRRHVIGPHTWGIVKGGELTVDDNGVVEVAPAFAYDGYGRELVLPQPRRVPAAERFELQNADTLDVWLVYRRDAVDAPLGESGCDDDDRVGRWSETPVVRFTAATGGGSAVAQRPPGVPQADIPFPPSRMPPDDPTREWPVFLGQIRRSQGQTPGTYTYRADLTGRPYAGARAASIEPPWATPGGTRLDLDPPSGQALELSVDVPSGGASNPILTVSDAGNVEIDGSATIGGDLKVGGGVVTFAPAAQLPPGSGWRIYHLDAQGQSPAELRIEIGASPGRVVIGSWSDTQSAFVAHLTIEDSGEVVVHGTLRVVGRLDVDFQAIRKAYLDGLNTLSLTGTDIGIRARITDADFDLGAALGWP